MSCVATSGKDLNAEPQKTRKKERARRKEKKTRSRPTSTSQNHERLGRASPGIRRPLIYWMEIDRGRGGLVIRPFLVAGLISIGGDTTKGLTYRYTSQASDPVLGTVEIGTELIVH